MVPSVQTHSPTALQTTTPPGLHHHCIPSTLLLHVGPLKNVPGRKLAGAIRVSLALYDGAMDSSTGTTASLSSGDWVEECL